MHLHAFPAKGLTDQVECASYSGVAKIGMVPLNNLLLEGWWCPDFVIESVYLVVSKSSNTEVRLVLLLVEQGLEFGILFLFLFD
jgi:hypothetical protein